MNGSNPVRLLQPDGFYDYEIPSNTAAEDSHLIENLLRAWACAIQRYNQRGIKQHEERKDMDHIIE